MIDVLSGVPWFTVVTLILFAIPFLFGPRAKRRRLQRREIQAAPITPPEPVDDWCPGCDRIVPAGQMGWSEDGDYQCGACLGITTSSGSAEIQVQLDDAATIDKAKRRARRAEYRRVKARSAAYFAAQQIAGPGSVQIQASGDVNVVVPPKGGGGVMVHRPHRCPDCEAFAHQHHQHGDVGEPFPFHDWGSSDTVRG